jgi:predicted ribosomally synthesized peptide with nif11-like leader
MSLENVGAFYQRIASDESFRMKIQNVESKEECSQIVKSAGFHFTQQELSEYNAQALKGVASDDDLETLDEKELASVFGGITNVMMYGLPPGGGLIYSAPTPIPRPWPRRPGLMEP